MVSSNPPESSDRNNPESEPAQISLRRLERSQTDLLPLSFAQKRLWFLDQLEGELAAYNIRTNIRMKGRLQTSALRTALEMIVARHEVLRTTYGMKGEEPVQAIQPVDHFELPIENLVSLSSDEQNSEIERLSLLETNKPFDLQKDLMLRGSLLKLSEGDHLLLLTMHHIASDGWSLEVLKRELANHYAALCHGTNSSASELPVQYADYASFQRAALRGKHYTTLLAYWRMQLQGIKPLEIPTDYPRPAVMSYQGASLEFEVNEDLYVRLKELSAQQRATVHMTMLTAFQVMLARYCGQDDIAVGIPIAGRNDEALKNLIGFFVNTLVIRSDLSGNPSFLEALSRVKDNSLDAYDHQELPFEKLVEELQPARSLGRSPLIEVLFQLFNVSSAEFVLEDLEVSQVRPTVAHSKFDLEVHLFQKPRHLNGKVIYRTDLFNQSSIERMIGHYLTLLEEVVQYPTRPIRELQFLTSEEQVQLLEEWNNTAVDFPQGKRVHELFEEQVEQNPDGVAVVSEDHELSYRELNERANQFAHCLLDSGIKPETLVAVCVERSPELVVGLLGILKAGGTYLPLNVEDPPQRLEFILNEAQADVIVTTKQDWNPALNPRTVIHPDPEKLAAFNRSNPADRSDPEAVAYVIYTSGSTGKPKGVEITHRSIQNLLLGIQSVLNLNTGDRLLGLAAPTFDISVAEILLPLVSGASSLLLSKLTSADPRLLAEKLPHFSRPLSKRPLRHGSNYLTQVGKEKARPL